MGVGSGRGAELGVQQEPIPGPRVMWGAVRLDPKGRASLTSLICPPLSTPQAIHGFRETEKSHWSAECQQILERVRAAALPPNIPHLGPVHVLDLDKNGYIKPHVDSVKVRGQGGLRGG